MFVLFFLFSAKNLCTFIVVKVISGENKCDRVYGVKTGINIVNFSIGTNEIVVRITDHNGFSWYLCIYKQEEKWTN